MHSVGLVIGFLVVNASLEVEAGGNVILLVEELDGDDRLENGKGAVRAGGGTDDCVVFDEVYA